MKKTYIQPLVESIHVQMQQALCLSGANTYQPTVGFSHERIDNTQGL